MVSGLRSSFSDLERLPWALHCRTAFDGIWPKPDHPLWSAQRHQADARSWELPTVAVNPDLTFKGGCL